jgi:hypothetical protein
MRTEIESKPKSIEEIVMAKNNAARLSGANPITFLGGVMGLAIFIGVGLLPSLLYGGYAGLILGSAIFGTPIHESVFGQATVVLGVISGVLAIGGIFVLGGAILGSGAYGLFSVLSAEREVPEEKEGAKVAVPAD